MKFLIAPDKFKHSLSSFQACAAIKEGVLEKINQAELVLLPMADGGDGLLETLSHYNSYKERSILVSNPLFRRIEASYLISTDRTTAIIEMAKASGLMLLKPNEYNCLHTSTFGTGELIKDAILQGVTKIILGIGGSATNEAGIGMAAALGYRFLDINGDELIPVGKNLIYIHKIDHSKVIDLSGIEFQVACDVTNTLTGEQGASKSFAQQKGADQKTIDQLEKGMIHISAVLEKTFGIHVSEIQGAGAAGGLGAGSIAFLNAMLISGIDLVLQLSKAEEYIKQSDLVISGEGKLDEGSMHGKVISGLNQLCQKHQKPLIVFCGKIDIDESNLLESGIKAYQITDYSLPKEEAYKQAYHLLLNKVANVIANYI